MNPEYRKSRFNYISRSEKGYLIYNCLYNSLSRINEEEYAQYLNLNMAEEKLLHAFIEQGIVVRKEIDELQAYHTYTFLASKYMKPKPNITVTPTMECNARCFYCYEEGIRYGRMDENCAEKIIEFIKKMDLSRGIQLTWFGGEPLLNQEWMDYFTSCLKKEEIVFSAFMISNGSKIDDEVILKMKQEWNIDSIQITFDGSCEEYARRKNYTDQDQNIYYRMLQTIKKLSNAGISVQIRLNIDRDNAGSILELVNDLQQVFYKNTNVSYYPSFLTGRKDALSEREKIDLIKQILEIDKNKLPVNSYLYRIPKTTACFYYQRGAYSVDINGDVFICERMLGHHDYALGNVKDKMEPDLEERELSGRREECQKCVFLPKCQGGCHDALIHGDTSCFIDKYIIKAYLEIL
ncbi:MAG: radical SAM protein [Eubacterium sp.]|nr:radical SAM protein [Eubacterium sp.]